MWIYLPNSFVSIVEDHNDKSRLLVRGRRRGDVEAFLAAASLPNEFRVAETATADYRFRVSVPREVVGLAVAAYATGISYTNFKDSVGDRARHLAYLDTWAIMTQYQRDERDAELKPLRR